MGASHKKSANTLKVAAGTMAGQLAMLAVMPLLTRIYSPEELGHVSVFAAVVGLFSTTACLHYELAIPLPRSDGVAHRVAMLSLVVVALMALILLAFIAPADGWFLSWVGASDLGWARWLLPLSLFLTGFGMVLTMCAIRWQRHSLNALSRVLQGVFQAVAQLIVAIASLGWVSLLVAQLVGMLAGMLPLMKNIISRIAATRPGLSRLKTMLLAKRYSEFPLVATPASVINAISISAPTLMLAGMFNAEVAGWYGMGYRILQLPARFLGQAISQVFMGGTVQARRNGQLTEVVVRNYRALVVMSLHTFVPVWMLAPAAFQVLFGSNWLEAGKYARYLSGWLAISFICTPLSMLVTVLQRQRQELLLQAVYLVLIAASLSVGVVAHDVRIGLIALGISGAAYLSAKTAWLLAISGCSVFQAAKEAIQEFFLAVLLHCPVLLMLQSFLSGIPLCVTAVAWVVAVHSVNFWYRKRYVFD